MVNRIIEVSAAELEQISEDLSRKKKLLRKHEEIQAKIVLEADFRDFVKRYGNSLAQAILEGYDSIVRTQGSRLAKMVHDDDSASKELVPRGDYNSTYQTRNDEQPIRRLTYRGRAFGSEDVSLSFIMDTAYNPCYYDKDRGRQFLTRDFWMDITPNDKEIPLPHYSISDKGKVSRFPADHEFREFDLTSFVQPNSFFRVETKRIDYESRVTEFIKEIVARTKDLIIKRVS